MVAREEWEEGEKKIENVKEEAIHRATSHQSKYLFKTNQHPKRTSSLKRFRDR